MATERSNDEIAAALHGLSAGDSRPAGAGKEAERVAHPKRSRPAVPEARAPSEENIEPQATPWQPIPADPAIPPGSGLSSSTSRARPATPAHLPARSYASQNVQVESVDYRAPAEPALRPRKPALYKSLRFRRAAIPILLTTGVMMLVMAIGRWIFDEAAPLAHLPIWTTVMLLVSGVAMIGLGVLNMLLVRNDLPKSPA
jgi:hypothetical protein